MVAKECDVALSSPICHAFSDVFPKSVSKRGNKCNASPSSPGLSIQVQRTKSEGCVSKCVYGCSGVYLDYSRRQRGEKDKSSHTSMPHNQRLLTPSRATRWWTQYGKVWLLSRYFSYSLNFRIGLSDNVDQRTTMPSNDDDAIMASKAQVVNGHPTCTSSDKMHFFANCIAHTNREDSNMMYHSRQQGRGLLSDYIFADSWSTDIVSALTKYLLPRCDDYNHINLLYEVAFMLVAFMWHQLGFFEKTYGKQAEKRMSNCVPIYQKQWQDTEWTPCAAGACGRT